MDQTLSCVDLACGLFGLRGGYLGWGKNVLYVNVTRVCNNVYVERGTMFTLIIMCAESVSEKMEITNLIHRPSDVSEIVAV